jgi:peptidoglycan/LPS O-acetylase OafA/YrhL
MHSRNNNFDFLRLTFASFVIVTHSYPLSGIISCDFLCNITNGQVTFSYIGVKGFFVISGYLIFQSLQRSENVFDYFWKRLLRLYPALFILLILTIVLAPFIYQSDVPFFLNKSIITYIPNNLSLYHIQNRIDGIFNNNPYKSTINGSLWTIPYEFTMYILLSFLIIFKKNKLITQTLLIISFLLLLISNVLYFEKFKPYRFILSGDNFVDLGIFFISGSLLAAANIEKLKLKKELLILFVILFILSIYYNFYCYSKYVTLPILIVLLGLNPIKFINNIETKIGDLSYGLYIYSFPIQQTLMYYFKLNFMELMVYSLIISCAFAYLSWHFIEKKALKYKKIRIAEVWKNLVFGTKSYIRNSKKL